MRAGGHTSTRGVASRDGGGSEGFFRGARYFYFSLFLCFCRQWRRIGPDGLGRSGRAGKEWV